MVNHHHDRVEISNGRKVSNEVHGEVLKRVGSFECKGGNGQDCRMDEHLICLADHAARDVLPDIDRNAWPSIIF